MDYTSQLVPDGLKLALTGRITYQDHVTFRSFIETVDSNNLKAVDVNLSKAEFIDSAGLGMLLLLRDAVSQRKGTVSLLHPQGQVQRLIDTSRFGSLFTVVP